MSTEKKIDKITVKKTDGDLNTTTSTTYDITLPVDAKPTIEGLTLSWTDIVNGRPSTRNLYLGSENPISFYDDITGFIPYYVQGTSFSGDNTSPVYINSYGQIYQCPKYAGATSITLNGNSKVSSTATIYAPETSGKANQLCVGGSVTTPGATTWTAEGDTDEIPYVSKGSQGSGGNKYISFKKLVQHNIEVTYNITNITGTSNNTALKLYFSFINNDSNKITTMTKLKSSLWAILDHSAQATNNISASGFFNHTFDSDFHYNDSDIKTLKTIIPYTITRISMGTDSTIMCHGISSQMTPECIAQIARLCQAQISTILAFNFVHETSISVNNNSQVKDTVVVL